MKTSTLALHSLRVEDNRILIETGEEFDGVAYSKFKYGDGSVSDEYGKSLAQAFIEKHTDLLESGVDIAVTSASYRSVPKGATSIAYFFTKYLNEYLEKIHKGPAQRIKITNNDSFVGDYASFSIEKREALMTSSVLTLSESVKAKTLIIIDDVRITGAGERRLVDFFADKDVAEIFLLYVAAADPAYASTNPQIESILNHTWMDGLPKLLSIMQSKGYMINARVCKYILSYPALDALEAFLRQLNRKVLEDLYENIVNDNYSAIPEYKDSIALVKKVARP